MVCILFIYLSTFVRNLITLYSFERARKKERRKKVHYLLIWRRASPLTVAYELFFFF